MMIIMGVVGVIFAIVVIGNESNLLSTNVHLCRILLVVYVCVIKKKTKRRTHSQNLNIFIGWIASKVKPEPSVLPPGGLTTAVPSAKEAGLPMTTPSVGRISTRRRAHSRKQKTTTPTPSKANTADGADDDDKESINPGEEETKAAIKRVIRALVNRQ